MSAPAPVSGTPSFGQFTPIHQQPMMHSSEPYMRPGMMASGYSTSYAISQYGKPSIEYQVPSQYAHTTQVQGQQPSPPPVQVKEFTRAEVKGMVENIGRIKSLNTISLLKVLAYALILPGIFYHFYKKDQLASLIPALQPLHESIAQLNEKIRKTDTTQTGGHYQFTEPEKRIIALRHLYHSAIGTRPESDEITLEAQSQKLIGLQKKQATAVHQPPVVIGKASKSSTPSPQSHFSNDSDLCDAACQCCCLICLCGWMCS
jgi:hypothetical protein